MTTTNPIRPKKYFSRYQKPLAEMPQLVLDFIHGPPWGVCFLVGEVFAPEEPGGKNPPQNPLVVRFDGAGRGRIRLDGERLERLDLGAWGDPAALQFKLVWQAMRHSGHSAQQHAVNAWMPGITLALA